MAVRPSRSGKRKLLVAPFLSILAASCSVRASARQSSCTDVCQAASYIDQDAGSQGANDSFWWIFSAKREDARCVQLGWLLEMVQECSWLSKRLGISKGLAL